ILDGVALDSPRAAEMRQYHELELQHRKLKPPPVDPPPAERVRMGLEKLQSGDLHAWTQLNFDLSLEPESMHYDPFQYKILNMPGWITADEATRQQILSAAQKYLINIRPQVKKWLGRNTYRHGDLSAYRALVLLREVDPDAYEHLDPAVWLKWA